jgi:serine/threonine protein kinase
MCVSSYVTRVFLTFAMSGSFVQNGSENSIDASLVQDASVLISPEHIRLEEQIGSGGFGVVYKGQYIHQTVAIKEISVQGLSLADQREVLSEIEIHSRLRSPTVLHLYGVCLTDAVFIVLEFAEYGSVARLYRSQSK